MTAEDVREHIARESFEPFRIRLTSGDAYDIRDPFSVALMKSRLFVAFPRVNRWVYVDYDYIAAIEILDERSNGRGKSRRKAR